MSASTASERRKIPWWLRGRWVLEYLALRLTVCAIHVLSPRASQRLAYTLSWVVADLFGFRRRVIRENLQAVYPQLTDVELSRIGRQMWYHLILMAFQVVLVPRKVHDTNWRRHVWIRDRAEMTRRLIDYRPLVVVTGHFGNFEMGGYVMGLLGLPSYTVARTLDNPYLDRYLNQFRELRGQRLLPKDGSASRIQEILDHGGMLGVLADQHAGTRGCWIRFLGRPAACHKAVALFTLTGQAPMMVSYCKQRSGPLQFEIGCCGVADPWTLPEALRDVTRLTQWYNDRLAEAIHADPSQYWWVHRRWKERVPRVTSRRRSAA